MKRFLLAVLLAVVGSAAHAQDILPLSSARPSDKVRALFVEDWNQRAHLGVEWVYCVEAYTVARTQDRDKVYIVEQVKLIENADAAHSHIYNPMALGCKDPVGNPLPIVHAHPNSDCSPSRNDILVAAAASKAPFQMILCGPGSTVSYSGQMYVDLGNYHAMQQP